jgi:hypothetical protein
MLVAVSAWVAAAVVALVVAYTLIKLLRVGREELVHAHNRPLI